MSPNSATQRWHRVTPSNSSPWRINRDPSVGRAVHGLTRDEHVAELQIAETTDILVMIAGHESDDGAGVSLGQHLPDNVAVDLWPVRRTLELPKIDDVTDEIEGLIVARVEEVE